MSEIKEALLGFELKNNTLKKVVKDDPKDRIIVEVGDSKQPDFKPQVKIMRWANSDGTHEVNFSMRAEEDPTATVTVAGGIVKYKAKDYEVHQYEKPEVSEDGGYEFEWVLPKKPKSNVLTATIQTKELDFSYQPALTEQEIAEGASRPDNVVGSYAVYHKTGRNNIVGGKEYKTGKAFHIYRPEAVDANGARTWCDLNVDVDAGVLTVTVPEEFLDSAVYPVTVDPTFGYTSVGASSIASILNKIYGAKFTSPSDMGTFTSLSVALNRTTGSTGCKGVIVLDSTLNIIANGVSDALTVIGGFSFRTFSWTSAPTLSASTEYDLGAIGEGVHGIAYDAGDTNQGLVDSTNSYASPSNPTDGTRDNNKYSVYATYTESGGSPSSSVSPSVSPSSSVSPSISPSASVSPSSSVSPSVSPSSSVSPSVSPSSSVSPSVSPSASVSPSSSVSPSVSPSSSVSPSVSPSSSVSPSVSPSASVSPSSSVSPSVSPSSSVSPSVSPSASVSPSSSVSPSVSPSASVSPSVSPSSSVSPSVSPSSSQSPSVSPSSSNSPSLSPSSSISPSPSAGTPQYYKNEPLHVKSGNYIFHLGAHRMPMWNEAGKPASPRRGMVGYNIDTLAIELWDGSAWKTFNSV